MIDDDDSSIDEQPEVPTVDNAANANANIAEENANAAEVNAAEAAEANENAAEAAQVNANEVPRRPKWVLERQFDNEEDFDNFLKGENCLSVRDSGPNRKGHKTLFRCNLVKQEGQQCDAGLYVIRKMVDNTEDDDSEHEIFLVYRLVAAHTHQNLPNKVIAINPVIRDKIIDLHKNGKPPMAIFYEMVDDENIPGIDQPRLKDIRNVIAKYKRDEFGTAPITMQSLCDYVGAFLNVPDNQDDAFVIGFYRSPPTQQDNKLFTVVISTPRLLRNAVDLQNIHADGTEKTTNENLPLIVVGSTDMKRTFHLIAIAITVHQDSDAYERVFRSVHDSILIITGKTSSQGH